MTTLRIDDGGDFVRLAASLRGAQRPVQRAVERAFDDVAKPLLRRMRAGGTEVVGSRGGLAAAVGRAFMTARVTGRGDRTRVELQLRTVEGYDLQMLDDGDVRHPVYGRGPWVTQRIRPGGFTDALDDSGGVVLAALRRRVGGALDEIGG